MCFDTKNGPVYEPENQLLNGLYQVLKKHAPTIEGSPLFEELLAVYEALEVDLKEENKSGKTTKIA